MTEKEVKLKKINNQLLLKDSEVITTQHELT